MSQNNTFRIFAFLVTGILFLACSEEFKVDPLASDTDGKGITGGFTSGTTGGITGGATGSATGSAGGTGDNTGSNTGSETGSGSGGGSGACSDPVVRQFCQNGGTPPNLSEVVQRLAARYPNELARCNRNNADEFVQIVVRELRAMDSRWGMNWVRGNIGDSNGDVVGYYYGPGAPTENSPYNSIVDVVGSCGADGNGESVTWGPHPPADYNLCCNPDGSTKWTIAPLR